MADDQHRLPAEAIQGEDCRQPAYETAWTTVFDTDHRITTPLFQASIAMSMSSLVPVPVLAHTYAGPDYPTLLVFTWACHLVLLLITTSAAWIPNRGRFKFIAWDCGQVLFPFAVFCVASEVHVPSVAGFFINGTLLGLAIGLIMCGRILITRKTKSDLLAFVWLAISCHIAAAAAIINPAERWMMWM